MRPIVVRFMAGISLGVIAVTLRASEQSAPPPTAAAPAGIVLDNRRVATTSTSGASSAPTPKATTRPSATPRAATTTPAGSPQVSSKPRPPVTKTTAPKPTPKKTSSTVTVNGASVDTRYGPVQVQVTITNGRIVSADAIDYPRGERRDRDINDRAIPQLNQETLDAQSSTIDTVSGATYTSDGYRESLQSALDAAHFGR